jgi:alkanesulfonate monooxygenase SsuD/methylene tetrahydromethanopterin reductase-like flavin-dependent oxidoreductase (luciferase family)
LSSPSGHGSRRPSGGRALGPDDEIAARTDRIELATAVTCPFLRYHPAVIAQAAATTALLSDGRFTLGVGAGERLNEHVVGRGWPAVGVGHEMLREALEIIRPLWSGGSQSDGEVPLAWALDEAATAFVTPDDIRGVVACGPDPGPPPGGRPFFARELAEPLRALRP